MWKIELQIFESLYKILTNTYLKLCTADPDNYYDKT